MSESLYLVSNSFFACQFVYVSACESKSLPKISRYDKRNKLVEQVKSMSINLGIKLQDTRALFKKFWFIGHVLGPWPVFRPTIGNQALFLSVRTLDLTLLG